MDILITGATGGLGRNAVEHARKMGATVRVTGRNQTVLTTLEAEGFSACAADLADVSQDTLRVMTNGCSAIWHCAALSAPWGAYRSFFTCNVQAAGRLFEAAALNAVPVFVHISTPAVYFDFNHRLQITEDFRPRRYVNHYAATKAEAELVLQALAMKYPGTRLVILRPRAIFGPHDQVLLPRLQRLMAAHEGKLPLPRGGRTVLDLTYAENVTHAMWLATHVSVRSGSVFNITNDIPGPLGEVLRDLFQRELGRAFQIRSVPYPLLAGAAWVLEQSARLRRAEREPALTRYGIGALAYDMTLDISAAKRQLGYAPVVPQDEALIRTAHWLKQHG
jgi:nucleoside-diphosphate-sugar epimerase